MSERITFQGQGLEMEDVGRWGEVPVWVGQERVGTARGFSWGSRGGDLTVEAYLDAPGWEGRLVGMVLVRGPQGLKIVAQKTP